jgi:hypothetical protein
LSCSFDAFVAGGFGDPDHVNTITATVSDDDGNSVSDTDSATVSFTDVPPSVGVAKGTSAAEVAEPGAMVTFTVDVANTSVETVTLTSLVDDLYGDLLDPANTAVSINTCPAQSTAIPVGGTFSCSFDAFVAGGFGDPDHVNTITATVSDDDGNSTAGSGSATISFLEATAELTGHVFLDYDGDGVQDPDEPPLPGVAVAVTDANGDVVVVTTDANGDWSVVVPVGEATMDVDETTVPDLHVLTTANEVQTVTVPVGGTATQDVGYQPPPAEVTGTLWLDLDGDPARHALEPPLAGVTVRLLAPDGTVVAETTTAADGSYEFVGLVPTGYTIRVDATTLIDGITVVDDPDAVVDGETDIDLDPGERLTGQDFVYRGVGVIGDTVWMDDDGDGVLDGDEDSIAGARVTLTWAGLDGVLGTGDDWTYPQAITGTDGTYRFTDLPPGVYRIAVVLSSVDDGLTPTTQTVMTVSLDPGETYLGGDFGFAAEGDALPYTGLEAARLALVALALALAGGALVGAARVVESRRRLTWRRRVSRL